MIQSLRTNTRGLLKSPGYSLVVIATLALGIGLTTALFAIMESIVLRPLPFSKPEDLMAVRVVIPEVAKQYPTLPVNAHFFEEWRRECKAFERLSVIERVGLVLTGESEPERVEGARVSADFMETLGVKIVQGRGFARDEDQEGRPSVALIGEELWRRRFGSDPDIVGRSILLDQRAHTVVGVLPHDFRIPIPATRDVTRIHRGPIEFLVPKQFPSSERAEAIGMFNYEVIGRLAQGATLETAEAQMNVVASRIVKDSGEKTEVRGAIFPLQASFVGDAKGGLNLLLGSASAVLLIACLNLSVLNLVRAERKTQEYEIRASLGASRATLFMEAMGESLILTAIGGLCGLATAYGSLKWMLLLAPPYLPRLDEVSMGGAAIAFALVLLVLCGALSAIIPALRLSRRPPSGASGAGSRTSSDSAASTRLQSIFVAAEVGIGTVLLTLGLLFAASYLRVLDLNQGFNASRVMSGGIKLSSSKYGNKSDITAFDDRLLAQVSAVSGVESVAIASALPLQGEVWIDNVSATDSPKSALEKQSANTRFVSGGFFDVLGVPLLEGRTFNDADKGRKVAVISQKLALRLWPGQSATGRTFSRGGHETFEVIGVTGDVRANADQEPVCIVYRPAWDWPMIKKEIVFRISKDALFSPAEFRRALRSAEPDLPVPTLSTMSDLFNRSTAGRRFFMILSDAFAIASVLIAVFGIYGVLSYWVARRRKEIGIRSALGAGPSSVRWLVLGRGMRPVLVGIVAGAVGSYFSSQLVSGLLYGSHPAGGLFFLAIPLVFFVVGALTCLVPVLQATRINPIEALRDS